MIGRYSATVKSKHFVEFYNLKIKTLRMLTQLTSKTPLVQPVTPQLLVSLDDAETVLESMAKVETQQGTPCKMRLKDEYILLYCAENEKEGPIVAIRLGLALTFQKILPTADEAAKQSLPQGALKGFRLTHQSGITLSFFIQFAELTRIWLRVLGRKLSQSGFHTNFKPIRKLGSGATASVYEVLRLQDGERLAAKVFSKQLLRADPQKFYSFKNQLEILRNLEHPNLMGLEGVYETDNSYYVVGEMLRGGNLFEYLHGRRTKLSIEEIRAIMRGIMKGLLELEREEVVHRDIKLENIMVRDTGSLQTVIVDFGLAVYAWEEDYGTYKCGTPGYLSPDIVLSAHKEKLAPKSDIFSAGVVFHVLLMGRYLFEGKDPKSVFEKNKEFKFDLTRPEYGKQDASALELLQGMLEIDGEKRFSASECLSHPFLREEGEVEKVEISPASTSEDYHF